MPLTPGRRYLGHYIGLASDGKPIYLVYCCVEDDEDETLPPYGSAYDYYYGYQDSGQPGDSSPSGDSGPPAGGISCDDCLARLCVVRDSNGRIVDVFYRDANNNYVRVPDCSGDGYYGSQGSVGSDSGGDDSGSENCDECLPSFGTAYQFEYSITYGGDEYEGIEGPQENGAGHFYYTCVNWSANTDGYIPRLQGPNCTHGYPPTFAVELCCIDGEWTFSFTVICPGKTTCSIDTDDVDISVSNCSPGPPTFTIEIKPGRCVQGSFVIRPV